MVKNVSILLTAKQQTSFNDSPLELLITFTKHLFTKLRPESRIETRQVKCVFVFFFAKRSCWQKYRVLFVICGLQLLSWDRLVQIFHIPYANQQGIWILEIKYRFWENWKVLLSLMFVFVSVRFVISDFHSLECLKLKWIWKDWQLC